MSDTRAIYSELRQPLLRTGALLAVLLLVMTAVGWFNARMDRTRQNLSQDFQGAVQAYREAQASEQILLTETARFAALRERGFIGAEPRLRWVEDVRETAERAAVLRIRYELEPRRTLSGVMATGSYQLFASAMRLQLELRHEGELLRFFELLEQRHGGLFELNACVLRRSAEAGETGQPQGGLNADCELRWYSLDTPSATPAEDDAS